ncbi:MAG TPA: matrixin family metalloprotease [Leptolyngbyaceae cyanobacterium]
MAQDTRLTLEEVFDPDYYRLNNPDLAGLSNQEALFHLRTYGFDEFDAGNTQRGKFSPFLDLGYYRNNNQDIVNNTFTGLSKEVIQQVFDIAIPEGRPISPYVDINFYRSNNPDLAGFDNSQLFRHIINSGVEEGRQFSPAVDLNFYRQNNPDLGGLSNRDLWEHFLRFGISEGRSAIPFFDANFYRDSNPDLAALNLSNEALLNDFLNTGLEQGRRFSPYFDVDYYLNNNPDLRLAFNFNNNPERARTLAFEHFQRTGVNEGRKFSRDFDVNYYLANEPDLRAAGLRPKQAFDHFINFGLREGRRPSLIYDPVYYLTNNPDLVAAGLNNQQAFQHFQTTGFNEGRAASVFFDPDAIAALLRPESGEANGIGEWIATADRWGLPPNGTLTYSFVTNSSASFYEGAETGVREVSAGVKNNVRNIMRQYSQYLPFDIVEVPDRPPNIGQIRIMFSNGPRDDGRELDGQVYAYAYFPNDFRADIRSIGGDIHLNPDRTLINYEAGQGSFAYQILLHEIGHALGLKHPFEAGPFIFGGEDNNTNSVMGYNFFPDTYSGSFPSTPMSYDIRALQTLYGARNINSGDTVYQFDYNNFIGAGERNGQNGIKQTIWDAGGIDTFDFSALPPLIGGYYFDMNEGGSNTTQFALNGSTYLIPNPDSTEQNPLPPDAYTTNSFGTTIAFGFELENLIGSQGDDEIAGNNLSNNIAAAAGNDFIAGGRGADIIAGGFGSDIFVLARGDGGFTPAEADIITDFTDGQDLIGLSIGLTLPEIVVTPGTNPNDTFIRTNTGEYLAVLANVPSFAINSADFTFV